MRKKSFVFKFDLRLYLNDVFNLILCVCVCVCVRVCVHEFHATHVPLGDFSPIFYIAIYFIYQDDHHILKFSILQINFHNDTWYL